MSGSTMVSVSDTSPTEFNSDAAFLTPRSYDCLRCEGSTKGDDAAALRRGGFVCTACLEILLALEGRPPLDSPGAETGEWKCTRCGESCENDEPGVLRDGRCVCTPCAGFLLALSPAPQMILPTEESLSLASPATIAAESSAIVGSVDDLVENETMRNVRLIINRVVERPTINTSFLANLVGLYNQLAFEAWSASTAL